MFTSMPPAPIMLGEKPSVLLFETFVFFVKNVSFRNGEINGGKVYLPCIWPALVRAQPPHRDL